MNLKVLVMLMLTSSVLVTKSGEQIVETLPTYTELVVAGDSYAQNFCKYEKDKKWNIIEYSAEGTTIAENYENLLAAFDSQYKIIFFSISVNDHKKNTHPADFEKSYRELINKAVEKNKLVFVHTYMPYPASSKVKTQYSTSVYDSMIRKLVLDYDNVYYIDMSDCADSKYISDDLIHYDQEFNDILYERLNNKIGEVLKK